MVFSTGEWTGFAIGFAVIFYSIFKLGSRNSPKGPIISPALAKGKYDDDDEQIIQLRKISVTLDEKIYTLTEMFNHDKRANDLARRLSELTAIIMSIIPAQNRELKKTKEEVLTAVITFHEEVTKASKDSIWSMGDKGFSEQGRQLGHLANKVEGLIRSVKKAVKALEKEKKKLLPIIASK